MDAISLYQLNRQVSQTLSAAFDHPLWVTAEIAQYQVNGNGHCYMELVEKSSRNGSITARAKAMIWANRVWAISQTFEQSTGQSLQTGMKVMLCVEVQFHESFGYSLIVHDIDPTYTLGDMARRRQEIIQRLTDEGMLDVNSGIPFPLLPQRIAIISAPTAAGYGDFCHQLDNNEYGVRFYHHLFPAVMQGQQTAGSVIQALDRIFQHQEKFDVVVIIRGGGAVTDLYSFDDYELALNIANFPLPVITGIGHERDQTVLDIVAHTSVKTPTAAAALLIDALGGQLTWLEDQQRAIIDNTRGRIDRMTLHLSQVTNSIRSSHLSLKRQIDQLSLLKERISLWVKQRTDNDRRNLTLAERTLQMAQPDNILRRGFSITRVNGHALTSTSQLKPGDTITTQLADGTVSSEVRPDTF